MVSLSRILNLDDFEAAARCHLPKPIFAYVSGATETNASLKDNRTAFSQWGFVPRVLTDVSGRTTQTTLFGEVYAAPFGIAPMGISALSAYRGDIVQARAAGAAKIPMVLSGSSLIPMEDVRASGPTSWFQAYLPGDEPRITALIERVAKAGFTTLLLTVDVAILPNRENNIRAGFSTPLRPNFKLLWDGVTHPRWSLGTFMRTVVQHGMPHFENSYATRGAPILSRNVERDFAKRDHLNWQHLALIRRLWSGRLVIKGILSPNDARLAKDHGVDGIIVSNHGGRQLDGSVAALRVLPEIVQAVGDLPVMLDGGVRRGSDVLKAIGLGARFVFVGRPFNYAASVAGEAGVAHAIALLSKEISNDMALIGINHLSEMSADKLMRLS